MSNCRQDSVIALRKRSGSSPLHLAIPVLWIACCLLDGLPACGVTAWERESEDLQRLFAEAKGCQERGDYHQAERLYIRYLQLAPAAAEARVNLGVVYAHENQLENALREYHTALKLNPLLRGVYLDLGIAYFR